MRMWGLSVELKPSTSFKKNENLRIWMAQLAYFLMLGVGVIFLLLKLHQIMIKEYDVSLQGGEK